MSILTLHLAPEGILFAADRYVTVTTEQVRNNVRRVIQGRSERPKVLKWPNKEAIIGYAGAARIASEFTDDWLYRHVIGEHLTFDSVRTVAERLTERLNSELAACGIDGSLLIHLAGFERIADDCRPAVWFIRNTVALHADGEYEPGTRFDCSEEISTPGRFAGRTGAQIRIHIAAMVRNGGFYSFRQGLDLEAFNTFDAALHHAIWSIIAGHPSRRHPIPESLEEWGKQAKLAVLGYAAYFQAFYPPGEQLVGGGADVVWARWPDA